MVTGHVFFICPWLFPSYCLSILKNHVYSCLSCLMVLFSCGQNEANGTKFQNSDEHTFKKTSDKRDGLNEKLLFHNVKAASRVPVVCPHTAPHVCCTHYVYLSYVHTLLPMFVALIMHQPFSFGEKSFLLCLINMHCCLSSKQDFLLVHQ